VQCPQRFAPITQAHVEDGQVNRQALDSLREYSTDGVMSFPAEVLIASGAKDRSE